MISSRTVMACAVLGSLIFQSGCSLLYELQPHRLQRMNRGPAPSLDPEFTQWKPPTSGTKSPATLGSTTLGTKREDADDQSATLSANSAEIAVVRAQSPEANRLNW